MRFYTFISEDEYRIVTLIKIEENSGQFMDEETFELETITKEELEKDYTLLSDYENWVICNFRTKEEFKDSKEYKDSSIWLDSKIAVSFLNNQTVSYPYNMTIMINMVIYKFVRKSVFDKLINYIIQLNTPDFQISQKDDIDFIWELYFRYINDNNLVIDGNQYSDILDMDAVVRNEAKIPDSVINDVEELLNIPILTYDPYELDDSVNLNNVNMKHFFIYMNDKYYIILYVIDTVKESILTHQNLQDHMDVVEFMLK